MVEIISLLWLSALDITLTHYQLFLDKKKGVLDMNTEQSLIPKLIMGNNPNPVNYVVGSFLSQGMLILISILAGPVLINIFFGMLLMVNYYHWIYIQDRKRGWDNKYYWKVLRKVKAIRRFKQGPKDARKGHKGPENRL